MSTDALTQQPMPAEWADKSPVRFIDDPYSEAAFGEQHKTYIDAGPVEMDFEAAKARNRVFGYGQIIKDVGLEPVIPYDIPSGLTKAHQLFINSAKQILGEEKFARSEIMFGERHSVVAKGSTQVSGRPHIDTPFRRRGADQPELVLIGLACNTAPTILLNGRYKLSSLNDSGRLMSVRALFKRFEKEPIPTEHLIIAGPSMLHVPGVAEQDNENRLFWRWHVKV